MRRLLNWLSRKRYPYEPLIEVSISRSRLLHNLNEFRRLAPGGQIAPVLKANAYGHGLLEVGRILAKEPNIPFFVVDSYFEAVALRSHGVRKPLLVIGYTRPRTILESGLKECAFAVTDIETLRALKGTPSEVHIHIKVDTGMRRQGIIADEIDEAIETAKAEPNIVVEGICTHLCDADNEDESFTDAQLVAWDSAVKRFKTGLPRIRHIHSGNTDGSRFARGTHDTLIRLGIGLYGLCETPATAKLVDQKPVLEMSTIVTSLRCLMKGETIGYGRSYAAPSDRFVATIPVGYYEGLDRRLSNNGFVQVGDAKTACPFVGRISMNISSVDVTQAPHPKVGAPVVIISRERSDPNSMVAMAKRCGTIDYEAAVRIPAHLKRVVVD